MSTFNKSHLRGKVVPVINGQFEKALRKFKKKVAESGILQELREREFYEKPTTARRKAKNQAKRRWQKQVEQKTLPKSKF
jgi:small subunit ribosomal protein S21